MEATKENLIEQYNTYKSFRKLAKIFDYSNVHIKNLFIKYNIDYIKPIRYTCKDDIFSKDNEFSFYLAGLWAADGNVRKSKGNYQVRIILKDKEFIYYLKDVFQFSGEVAEIFKNNQENFNRPDYNNSYLYGFSMSSKQMFNDLARFNVVPNKTNTYAFPQWLISHPLVNHFMRGYMDGDGSLYIREKGNQLHFSIVGNKLFVKDYLNEIVKNTGLHLAKIDKFYHCEKYSFTYGGNGVTKKICELLYKDATIYLPRKYEKTKHVLK